MAAPLSRAASLITAIRNYLATATQVANWANTDSSLAPPSDGSLAVAGYAGAVRLASAGEPMLGAAPVRLAILVRVLLAQDDSEALDAVAVDWAQWLDTIVMSLSAPQDMKSFSASLVGTHRGFVYTAKSCVKIQPLDSGWSIERQDNPDGGGVAVVSRQWVVEIWRD